MSRERMIENVIRLEKLEKIHKIIVQHNLKRILPMFITSLLYDEEDRVFDKVNEELVRTKDTLGRKKNRLAQNEYVAQEDRDRVARLTDDIAIIEEELKLCRLYQPFDKLIGDRIHLRYEDGRGKSPTPPSESKNDG